MPARNPTTPSRPCPLRIGTSDWSEPAAGAHDARERALAELAGGQHGIVSLAQITALGMSKGSVAHRVRQGRLLRVHRGVYAVGLAPPTPSGRQLAAVLACGDGAVLSHTSAAAAWGLRAPQGGVVHLTVPPGNGSASRRGIRVHRGRRLEDADAVTTGLLPVTSIARTLVDLGDVARPEQVRRAFVRAEQLRAVDMTQVDAALASAGRRRGAAVLRSLLAVYDPRWQRTRSDLELAMLDLIRDFGLPEPRVNEWLLGRFLVDFLWRDVRVVVETDGRKVHGTATALRDDARRDRALRAAGFKVLRVANRDVRDQPARVAKRVARALSSPRARALRADWDQ